MIAGMHLAGVMVWWANQHSMQLASGKPRLPTITVWLTAPALPEAGPRRSPQRPQDRAGATGQRKDSKPSMLQQIPDVTAAGASTNPVLSAVTPGSAEALTPTVPATSATSALNLTLSRKDIASVAPRSFADLSPFHGRLPKTVERQIANATAQSGPWVEERIDNDRIRLRRGNTCVMMERPRAASLDPMNEASGRMPWRASKAEECND